MGIFALMTFLLLLFALDRMRLRRKSTVDDADSRRQSRTWERKELDGVVVFEAEASNLPIEIDSRIGEAVELPSGDAAAVELPVR